MGFVKLDCAIVDSSLWVERDHRSLFITALVMAEPFEFSGPHERAVAVMIQKELEAKVMYYI